MKKIIFILSGILFITVSSCNKEDIRPNNSDCENHRSKQLDGCDGSDYNNKSNNDYFNTKVVIDSLFNITDPNRDEDDDRKIKKK